MPSKTKSGRVIHMPTAEEEAQIQKGIAADPDNPELSDEFFAKAKRVHEVFDAKTAKRLVAMKRPRGRPQGSVAEHTKVALNMRVDPDVMAAMRETGTGWQTRVNDLLRREFVRGSRKAAGRG